MFFTYTVFVCCLGLVLTSSFSNKKEERNYEVSSVKEGPKVDWLKIDEAMHECLDDLPICKDKSKLNCKVMHATCKLSCGNCNVLAAPPDCKKTRFGCCWDNVTIAKSPDKNDCPQCVDQYSECKERLNDCDQPHVRVTCPTTCGIPCKQCLDNKYQEPLCPMYKRYGFCTVSKVIMSTICKKTCNLCKDN